ncbi:hypothetical protein SAMN03159444_04438 [Pseudomonas sp. NFACC02]|nr:hypothetical protein SAMN03159444_04438 [Pseudomonas sp. NFACC02]
MSEPSEVTRAANAVCQSLGMVLTHCIRQQAGFPQGHAVLKGDCHQPCLIPRTSSTPRLANWSARSLP